MAVSERDVQQWFDTALVLTKKAGEVVAFAFHRTERAVDTKANETDLVTETDRQVEKMLFDGLRAAFPTHKFIGEETAAENPGDKLKWSDEPTWIIDPIDGTTNFVARLPHVAISVALTVDKQVQLGIIYNPITGDCYTATRGGGAYKNGFPIRSSPTTALGQAVLATAVGSVREPAMLQNYLANFNTFLEQRVRGHRSMGSAAIHMALVAEGALDMFLEYGIHCWDIAAGVLLVREAGGVAFDPPASTDVDLMRRCILAAGTRQLAEVTQPLMKHTQFPAEADLI